MWLKTGDPDSNLISFFNAFRGDLFFSYSGLVLDLLIVPAVLWRRTRWYAFIIIAIFHFINSQLFSIGIFPWLMLAATLIVFNPNLKPLWNNSTGLNQEVTKSVNIYTLIIGAVFVIYNIIMPFRHFLYPGNVNWTEEGHKFAWHMKLRAKTGISHFFAFNPKTHRITRINDSGILLNHQLKSFNTDPDKIIKFARYLKKKFYPREQVEIRANVFVSLNGRPYSLFIDSTVDLAKIPISLLPNNIIILKYPALPAIGNRHYELSD
jgi:hypothetical protein